MSARRRLAALATLATLAALALCVPRLGAQDLTPRAYVISPVRSNAVSASYIFNDGELLFEGTVPITDATGRLSVPALTLYRSLSFFGRSANVTATLPYGVGNFKGTAFGAETSVYRSGLLDSVFRFSVNLKGGPAMKLSQMRTWRQKTLIGASLKIVAPTGQYDPTKLINLGGNRWAIKPELAYSGRFGHFVLDGYAAVWFFTENHEFFSRNQYFSGTRAQTQEPDTGLGDPRQLRRQAALLGLARRQLLARRAHEPERSPEPRDTPDRTPASA